MFGLADQSQAVGNILGPYALEVKNLATRQDGRQDFVLFGGGQDEFGVGWRFLQGFEEGIKGRCTQHVDLVHDINLEGTALGRITYLFNQGANVIHRIVGGSVQFMDGERPALVK